MLLLRHPIVQQLHLRRRQNHGDVRAAAISRQPMCNRRRHLLFWGATIPALVTITPASIAADDALLPLPGSPVVETPLPKDYVELSRKLLDTLTEAISIDVQGGEEKELRRAADPAKDLVKQWITQWNDAPGVVGNDSHTQIQATIRELGDFYRRNGQRARLPKDVGQSLLDRLGVAAAALPDKPPSLLDRLLGGT